MRSLQRVIHYCDFCKKHHHAKRAMENHERGCTLNPDRTCRMCGREASRSPSIREMVAAIDLQLNQGMLVVSDEQFEKFQAQAESCPACVLAVIRQLRRERKAGAFVIGSAMNSWNYKQACEQFWREVNKSRGDTP